MREIFISAGISECKRILNIIYENFKNSYLIVGNGVLSWHMPALEAVKQPAVQVSSRKLLTKLDRDSLPIIAVMLLNSSKSS